MTITLSRFKATLLWVWTGTELLASDDGAAGYWVADASKYTAAFEALRAAQATTYAVSLPWKGESRQRFWSYYTARSGYEPPHQREIAGSTAYRLLIPFRVAVAANQVEGPETVDLYLEAFLLPIGLGVALTVDVRGERTLEQGVDELIGLASKARYTTAGLSGPVNASKLRETVFGQTLAAAGVPAVKDRIGSEAPFVLVTVTSADGAAPVDPAGPEQALHRALYGFASLSPSWRENPLPAWSSSAMPQSNRHPQGQACFSTLHGRSVWHPSSLTKEATAKQRAGLNCYHRNLMFGALQSQALVRYLRLVSEQRAAGAAMSTTVDDLAGYAAGAGGRLYGKAAYHSWSVRRWINDEVAAVGLINAERQSRGMKPLA